MIRSLFVRVTAALASLIFVAPVAFAAFDSAGIPSSRNPVGMDLSHARVWVDQTCTDAFSVPATNEGAVNVLANVDTMEEAINPDNNIGNAVQTSGSADGWCDATPWVMRGTLTMGASQWIYFGPLQEVPKQGFLMEWDFDAVVTNYAWWFGHRSGLNVSGSTGVWRPDGGMVAVNTLGSIVGEVSPMTSSSGSQYQINFDNFWFVQGRRQYIGLLTTGAGVFTFGMETVPFAPYYEEN